LAASVKLFQSNQYQQLFAQYQLADFSAIWARDIAWFESPNERRGGWSGVGVMEMQDDVLQSSIHAPLRLFVKKQQNHGRKSWRHPFAGEPTFRREFANLKFLAKHSIGAPKLVYYAENMAAKQAILITEELTDFVPLDTVQLSSLNQAQQHTLIQTVATEIKRFHNAGLVHRALYPKHIFVKNAQNTQNAATEIALIDLEKARFSPLAWYRAYFDLAAFTRHAIGWSADNKQLFIKTYFAKQELNFFDKLLCNMINRRAKRG
jgi:tRNA A-37 threonylcarbamoyl transferase component Bud32